MDADYQTTLPATDELVERRRPQLVVLTRCKQRLLPASLLDTRALAHFVRPVADSARLRNRPVCDRVRRTPHCRFRTIASSCGSFRQKYIGMCHRRHSGDTTARVPARPSKRAAVQPLLVEWANELPRQHFLPIDHTLHGAEADKPEVRTVVHLHGGRTRPESDGYPEDWFVTGQSATCFYQNQQEATSLFYHDHAMGITRLNAVAGLMGLYLIRDEFEDSLNLPKGAYEIPLVIFDRSFRPDGQLYYPVSGKPGAPWVSEYYGSAILVNGKIFPYHEVEPRKYRLRLLEQLQWQLLPALFFSGCHGEFRSSYVSPDRQRAGISGRASADESAYPGTGRTRRSYRGFQQSRRQGSISANRCNCCDAVPGICQTEPLDTSSLPTTLRPVPRIPESAAVRTRELTLADYQNRLGRSSVMLLNGAHWDMPVTERPVQNSTEIWSFINLTDDSHPIHLHMVRFQLLDRRPFDLSVYQLTGKVVFTGPAESLTANELGWKDTVRVDPMTITRIIVKFEGFAGRYVWHCHMLEHEDNEMMRPYVIVPE